MLYDQSGFYAGLAGFAVSILAKYGINTTVTDVMQVVGGVLVLYGMLKQAYLHRKAAIAGGYYPEK